ncbi:MAG: hypothetical protein NDJ72_04885 [Elusimicrobia bacterium]|nr:hypothetical protein [Elusimicrobiota bacterium]
MRRALAALIVASSIAPSWAPAQVVGRVSFRAAPVLPSAPVPSLGTPAMSLNPSSLTPLSLAPSLVPADVLPSITPVVAVQAVSVKAVPHIPFAAAVGDPAPQTPSEPAREPASESAAAQAGALFDGTAAVPPAAPEIPAPAIDAPAAPLGAGLRMARAEHEPWLNAVVGLLSGTRTGRRVLRDIDRLAAARGVPVMLDVKAIGNNGEFRYDSDLLVMDSGHLKRDPFQSAPILAHELQHVLQRAMELPADALELEIESYTVESRVWSELGVEPEAGSFARMARSRLLKDAAGFAKWLGKHYKNNIALYGSTMDGYVAALEKKLESSLRSEAKTRRKIKAVERVLESMRANGMSEDAIAAHRREDLEPLERSLRDGAVNRGWIERDLLRLKEPAIRERFAAYSRGVMRRARSLSRP